MELVTPAVGGPAAVYTFESEGPGAVELPPVWRCRCGFQIDAYAWQPATHPARHAAAAANPAKANAPYAA